MNGVSAADLYRLRSVTQPVSNGQSCFFVENSVDRQTNQYQAQIASVDEHRQYQVWVQNGINVNPLQVGDQLYYLHLNHRRYQLMRLDLGNKKSNAIPIQGSVSQLKRRGSRLYFKVTYNTEIPKFKTARFPQVRHVYRLVNKQDGYGWLPNHAHYQIMSLNLKTDQMKTLFRSRTDFDFQSVSPDYHQLIYLQSVSQDSTQIHRAVGAFMYNIQTRTKQLINKSVRQGVFHSAQFSPHGRAIALIGNDNRYPSATVNDFWWYDIKSQRLTDLTDQDDSVDAGYAGGLSTDFAQQRSNCEMHWLDDQHCLFHAYHHAHSQLYVSDGQRVKLVNDALREIYDFNVVTPHGVVLSSSKQAQPCELRLLNLRTGRESLLYNPNQRYERHHEYAKVDSFTYQSEDHSVRLNGWVMHAMTQSSKSPVILYVHGGPHDAYGESFFHEFQVLAAHGYSIVYVNPRGSTTYGQQFETDVIGHYGQHDFEDVMSGLRAALQRFQGLDQRNVFIVGGSYGGFMTLWAIGHTNRFRGAIAQRPLADWPMMYGTSDIGLRFCQDELGKDLYRDRALDFYWRESPIAYAQNVKTPLLLQHGEYDMRCPASQSEAYFTVVKQTGDEVTYWRYPQGYHGVSRHGLPSLRVQRIEDILTWLNHHMK